MNKAYTETEIINMFNEDDTIDPEFKSRVNTITNAWMQAMYSSIKETKCMKLNDTHGDLWQETHQVFNMLYQRYND